MRRTTALAAIATAALLALTGCSDDGGDDDKATKPAGKTASATAADDGRAELEAAVSQYTKAFFEPDADTGYGMLSKRCAAEIDQGAYAAQVEQAAKEYGKQKVTTVSVDQVSGDMARVTYEVSVPKFSQQSQPWTREDGEWKYDAC
ncbi:hypothetical protein [Streptomyces youssoufiensis]